MFIHTYELETAWQVAAFKTPKENRREITRWCYQTFGTPGMNTLTKQTRWKDSIQYGEIYFGSKEDLMMFVLRWS
jgi:hypothetical protein